MRYDTPVRLKSERAWRTYHGGRLIDEMQGLPSSSDTHFPEDWIMSTVRAINAGREEIVEGLNRLADADLTLKDFIAADPVAALGAAHVAKWGESPAVLVKLIDAAERLGIQCHPDKDRARQFFGSPFGKTECWHIVGGRAIDGEKPCVYMGFKPGVTENAWRDVFDRQDIPAMLGMLHRIEVKPGDTFLIEGGMPHAIGAGCLLVEIQEPTDYTFRTEKVTPQGFAISERPATTALASTTCSPASTTRASTRRRRVAAGWSRRRCSKRRPASRARRLSAVRRQTASRLSAMIFGANVASPPKKSFSGFISWRDAGGWKVRLARSR